MLRVVTGGYRAPAPPVKSLNHNEKQAIEQTGGVAYIPAIPVIRR
jgi:hypothetical protein